MKTICNISRFIGEIFVFVGKFGLFVYFVLRMLLIDKIMIKKQIHTLCICRWKALQTTAVSIARKFCFMQWKIKFPTRENKVSPI